MLENLNLGTAKITYDDLSHIREDIPLSDQLMDLKEDMLQIDAKNNHTIDVGYYPDFSKYGEFKIVVIKEYDWEKPVWSNSCKDLPTLKKLIQDAIDIVK